QRQRVSEDDTSGPQGDYLDVPGAAAQPGAAPMTGNGGTTVTPYIITFRSFSSEISQVLANFAASPNGFIVKTINVQPASATPMNAMNGGMPGRMPEESIHPMQ